MLDHAVAEAAFVVEHVMRDAQPVGDHARVVDVLPGAARPGALHRLPVVVKLERHPDDLSARARGERGHDRAVDAAGHGDDDPCFAKVAIEAEINLHWNFLGTLYPNFTPVS